MFFHLIVFFRWVRLTTRRYGFWAVFTKYRPKRAGFGHGLRVPFCQHSWGTPAMYLVGQLQAERGLAVETGMLL
jgi:hypothetical protein